VRRFVYALAALGGAAILTAASGYAAGNDSNYLPNPTLTPGKTAKVDVDKLCSANFAAPALSDKKKEEALTNYGLGRDKSEHVVDFLVPQSLGGSDSLDNLWPMAPKGEFGADKKDQLEAKLHELVCSKQMKLADAQKEIRKNWVKAYRQYVGGETTAAK
jgi:hypothetical protein